MIHIPEEKIIDLALGNITSADELAELEHHLASCARCQHKLSAWRRMTETESNIEPSAALKEKIWQDVTAEKPRRKAAKVPVIVSIAAAAVLLFALGLYQLKPTVDSPAMEVAQNDDIAEENLLHYPETKQLAIVPVSDFNHIRGNLWINNLTEEMLLEVDGLIRLKGQDYQLWIIYDNNDIQGELLSIEDGASRVLFKGPDIREFKLIKASVEPKGGSQKPTGPETFVVPLKQEMNYFGF